jgi:hypothetical protein
MPTTCEGKIPCSKAASKDTTKKIKNKICLVLAFPLEEVSLHLVYDFSFNFKKEVGLSFPFFTFSWF